MRLLIGSCLHLEVFAYLPCYFSLYFRFVLQGVLTWTEIHRLKWKIDICRHVTRVARSLTVSLRGLWAKWISAFFLAIDESITVSLVKYKLFLILFYENSEFLDLFSMNGWKKLFQLIILSFKEIFIATIMVTMRPTWIYINIVWQPRVRE